MSLKRLVAISVAFLTVGIAIVIPLRAQETTGTTTDAKTVTGSTACADTNSCLNSIVQNTYGSLVILNQLPTYFEKLIELSISWLSSDESATTPIAQAQFTVIGNLVNQALTYQMLDPIQLAADTFQVPRDQFTPSQNGKAPVLSKIPNINDLAFSTLLGQPPIPNAPGSPYNYVKFISGMNLPHIMPSVAMQGKKEDVDKYIRYYGTVKAIESFNGYALNNQYVNAQPFTLAQTSLISLATSPEWFTKLASKDEEPLGAVLRQMLLFESQSYVLLTQLIQIQRQILAAQIMTNVATILVNQPNESVAASKAKGERPTG